MHIITDVAGRRLGPAHMHPYICIHTCRLSCIYMHTNMHAYTYRRCGTVIGRWPASNCCMHTCIHVCNVHMYAYIQADCCIHTCMQIRMHKVHMYAYIHAIYMHKPTHAYTYRRCGTVIGRWPANKLWYVWKEFCWPMRNSERGTQLLLLKRLRTSVT